ncbi:hypothetical protein ARMSODRAFT_899668 [Armillaria solidipes]|uniref:Ribonuclease H1 N-terminal domain-containing protein n=1 Tax=Armillaria solidipes TaxID=1076256 RepID=A0A2H3B806_9AGAR|nr:hypothetical protein ARMSODRAFT_899668 [Armillaria solidipes]
MTTTVVRPPRRGGTPQAQSPPPFIPSTPVKPSIIKREATPTTPRKTQHYAKQNSAPSPATTPSFRTPTKFPLAHQYPLKRAGEEKATATPSFDRLRPRIPHPNELREPSPVLPPVKKWYVVTVGQDVGIFSSWLDVAARIRGVPEPAHISRPTYAQAVAEYRQQFDTGKVQIVLVPGSQKAEEAKMAAQVETTTFEDEYGEFTYDEDVEQAIYEAEVYAKAERAYRDVLLAHGFTVPK